MWILIAMIAIMPLEENPYLLISDNFLGVLPRFTMIKLLGIIGLGWSVVSAMTTGRGPRLFESNQGRAFGLLLAIVVVGSLTNGAGVMSAMRLLAIVCFFPLVLTAVRRPSDVVLILQACAGVMVLIFPYAYRQVMRFGGRLGVGLYEANYFGLLLVLVLPIAFALARTETNRKRVWLWMAGVATIALEIVLTGSRGAFVSAVIVVVLLCWKFSKRPLVTLGMAGAIGAVLVFVIPNPLAKRLLASGLSDVQDTSVEVSNRERMDVLRAGLRMVAERPVTGVGLGMFKGRMQAYGFDDARIAHDSYLELAAEVGIPGLLCFLWVLWAAFRSLGRSERLLRFAREDRLAALSASVRIGLCGYAVGAVFLSAQYEKFFWLTIFLSISMERIARALARRAKAQAESAEPQTAAATA